MGQITYKKDTIWRGRQSGGADELEPRRSRKEMILTRDHPKQRQSRKEKIRNRDDLKKKLSGGSEDPEGQTNRNRDNLEKRLSGEETIRNRDDPEQRQSGTEAIRKTDDPEGQTIRKGRLSAKAGSSANPHKCAFRLIEIIC